jgi:ribosomal protein L21E
MRFQRGDLVKIKDSIRIVKEYQGKVCKVIGNTDNLSTVRVEVMETGRQLNISIYDVERCI